MDEIDIVPVPESTLSANIDQLQELARELDGEPSISPDDAAEKAKQVLKRLEKARRLGRESLHNASGGTHHADGTNGVSPFEYDAQAAGAL